MAVDSSSTNDSLVNPDSREMECLISRPNIFIATTFHIISICLHLPLSIFILYHGLQRLRSSSSSASMSHSDCFTYHMVLMELIGVLISVLFLCALYKEDPNIFIANSYLATSIWYGETLYNVLTCLERYLAVVHPITYRNLRNERGIRIRNICIGCGWLLFLVAMSTTLIIHVQIAIGVCLTVLSLVAVSFCSLAVLRVLIRPGPQEQGRKRADQFKRRAFYTIVAILAVLVLRFTWGLVWTVLDTGNISVCLLMVCGMWFNFPSTLMLPLLFLYREVKLMWCKNSVQVE